ncbi:MAG: nucleoside-diphosphate kinase [Candidatus Nanoarchaeia archaeon]|nr:nucleoside-diphosphate kinase [Candidatus Nanoarchaeia archaeon]MDD5358484.1 nucleoside-diphosphate kinase [Candidatus Nanoarchaeia archaeon]MDD5588998.1 nucleoside-diphosphate kinase [Candidatus Nanoarchaeia archaeon]
MRKKIKMEERTLVLIKPDGLVKSLTGNIITMLSETKLKIVGSKVVKVTRELAEKHYGDLKNSLIKKFGEEKGKMVFENTLDYIQGKFHTDRVLAMVYKGKDAVKKIRELAGETNPEKASPVSIRGKYGRIHSETKVFENVIHCSDSAENAEREIALWFKKDEVVE